MVSRNAPAKIKTAVSPNPYIRAALNRKPGTPHHNYRRRTTFNPAHGLFNRGGDPARRELFDIFTRMTESSRLYAITPLHAACSLLFPLMLYYATMPPLPRRATADICRFFVFAAMRDRWRCAATPPTSITPLPFTRSPPLRKSDRLPPPRLKRHDAVYAIITHPPRHVTTKRIRSIA